MILKYVGQGLQKEKLKDEINLFKDILGEKTPSNKTQALMLYP